MITVLFEVVTKEGCFEDYIKTAAGLKPQLSNYTGLLHGERFESLTQKGKLLSLSKWATEEELVIWRNDSKHRQAQHRGMYQVFDAYMITVVDDHIETNDKVLLIQVDDFEKSLASLKEMSLDISYDFYQSLVDKKILGLIHVSKDIEKLKNHLITDHIITEFGLIRQYGIDAREQAPKDSNKFLL